MLHIILLAKKFINKINVIRKCLFLQFCMNMIFYSNICEKKASNRLEVVAIMNASMTTYIA